MREGFDLLVGVPLVVAILGLAVNADQLLLLLSAQTLAVLASVLTQLADDKMSLGSFGTEFSRTHGNIAGEFPHLMLEPPELIDVELLQPDELVPHQSYHLLGRVGASVPVAQVNSGDIFFDD